jgi:hypothetical protein
MYEADCLGEVRIIPEYEQRLQALARGRVARDGGPYITFDEAVRLAKEFQPWDPTIPEREFSRELRLAVIEALGIPEDQLDHVRMYTALRSRLDDLHKVDGFLEVDDPSSQQPIRVTLDLSTRPAKAPETGIVEIESLTHLIVGELSDVDDPTYHPLIEEVAAAAAESIRRQRPSSTRSPAPPGTARLTA